MLVCIYLIFFHAGIEFRGLASGFLEEYVPGEYLLVRELSLNDGSYTVFVLKYLWKGLYILQLHLPLAVLSKRNCSKKMYYISLKY